MPQLKSAVKSMHLGRQRHLRNIAHKSELKTLVKKFETLLDQNKKSEAESLLREVISKISKARTKGILHRKTASRKISRLARKLYKQKG